MIGSTDTHTSLATTEENNFFGKTTPMEPTADPARFKDKITGYVQEPVGPDVTIRSERTLAAGLAAAWATDNTREALWDAMARKEVYATTGPRIITRFFAGWDFVEADVQRPDFAQIGYLRGVPMGGDGELHERVYDVICSDDRKITDQHRCAKPVGNTVDVKTATYTNSIGEALMLAYWEDPDFDAGQRAFYYLRVLEIPTPRWTTYDAAFFGVERPEGVPATQQERAYTSQIWYTPS
jgi:hypothetical protein